jgi:single-stranded DNA-binding protein
MNDTNYIGGVIKILETPKQTTLKNNLFFTKCRAQMPQLRNTRLITLLFWGNLAQDVATYYKINDYLIIEGYVSLQDKEDSKVMKYKSKQVQITVSKIYPFLLNYDHSLLKI